MAGCPFAKDMLESFLVPIEGIDNLGDIRDYVDDITITCRGYNGKQTTNFKGDSTEVKCGLHGA